MAPFKTISLNVSADAVIGTTLSAGSIIYASGLRINPLSTNATSNNVIVASNTNFIQQRTINPQVWQTELVFVQSAYAGIETNYVYKQGPTGGPRVEIASIYDTGPFLSSRVGINTITPNKALTVNGEISANNTIYDNVGNSNQWNSAFTTIQNTSAFWEESAEIIPTVTNYLSTNNVQISALSVKGPVLSGNNVELSDIFSNTKYIFNDIISSDKTQRYVYYGNGYQNMGELGGSDGGFDPDASWTKWFVNLGNGPISGSNYDGGFLIYVYPNEIKKINYNGTSYSVLESYNLSNSQQWDTAYNVATIVQSNSASWEETADIIPTVTNYLSTNNVQISALTITNAFSGINSLTITGNISGNNLRTSFNQGSAVGNFSFAVNSGRAVGEYSHAEGVNTQAIGGYSHAEGVNTQAIGGYSHAEGIGTTASGNYSHAEGWTSMAFGDSSHAEGQSTRAYSNGAHSEGSGTIADGAGAHSEGSGTIANSTGAHAEGNNTIAYGNQAHAQGSNTVALGSVTHAEGDSTVAAGKITFSTYTSAADSFFILTFTPQTSSLTSSLINGNPIAVIGSTTPYGTQQRTLASFVSRSTTTGAITGSILSTSIGGYNFQNNQTLITPAQVSHAEGSNTTASGNFSHAEGQITVASGQSSHAEGNNTTATNVASHAEGVSTQASGYGSHAEGGGTVASGPSSHAEGVNTTAPGHGAHTEGAYTRAIGGYSHAGGLRSVANTNNSWIWRGVTSPTYFAPEVFTTRTGQFMVSAEGGVVLANNVGIGTDSIANALTVAGNISATSASISTNLSVGGTVFSTGSADVLAKYTETIGNNSTFTINHNFQTTDIQVQVYRVSDGTLSYPTIEIVSASAVAVKFAQTIPADSYKVIVHGTVPSTRITAYAQTFYVLATGLDYLPLSGGTLSNNLTVLGNISATGSVFSSGGNSNNWNSTFTIVQANTATDSFDLSYVGTLPVPLTPIYTTNPLRDDLLGASGSQATTLRNGKWITGLSMAGSGNPAIDNLLSLSSSDIVGIRDSLSLSNLSELSAISFPSLVSVGGAFTINSGVGASMSLLTTLSFPSLVSVGGGLIINSSANMSSLASLSFPSLVSVGGGFSFNNGSTMAMLTALSFPSLVSVGGAFTGNGGAARKLTVLSYPSLAFVGGAFTGVGSGNANLITLSYPSLSSVVGNFTGNSTGTVNSVTSISLSSLASVGGSFVINSNGSMNSVTTISLPSLAFVGGGFTINSGTGSSNSLTTFLLGSTLKHIDGNFTSIINASLDRHNAWSANTYYASYISFTASASSFSSTTTGTTCTVNIVNHGLQTNDIITISGITGAATGDHNFNAVAVPVTRIDANSFSYTIVATTQMPTGTATIQRQEVAVTPVTKNGRKYICTGAGTSGGTEPTWPTTIGQTVADGTVTWTCSEMSLPNILSRLDALNGTNQTVLYGANRFINIAPSSSITVNSINTTAGVATITTATNHGITTGTQVVISGCTGTALRYNGVWTVTSTGLTTLTTPVPTDLNGVAGAGTMRLATSCPQYTGLAPVAATSIVGAAADSHMILSVSQIRDVEGGAQFPIFVAGIYSRNGSINGFARYSCTENSWDIWYDTTSKRWVNTPTQFTGNAARVGDYPHTPQSVPLASTSSANPAVITSSVNHGIATGAVFTVVIEGCSNNALNGSWTATSTGLTTFTIPVDGSGGATTSSGTVAVLNQTFNQGRLMTGTVASPIQGVEQTITTGSNHGFSNGDFIHVYGSVGTHATSITDLNTNATTKSVTTAITVTNATNFTHVRYSNTQPFIGSYSLTTMPHMRDPSVNDVAFHTTLKLRARGLAVSLHGITGL